MEEQAGVISDFYEKYKPYFVELRKHLFFIAVFFAIGCALGFIYNQEIFNFIIDLYNLKGVTLISTSPYQYIELTLSITFLAGLFTALPYLLLRLYFFFKPALKLSELKMIKQFAPLVAILFAIGFGFGLWVMQIIINLYAIVWKDNRVNSLWDIQHFFSQVMMNAILTGLVFQIPIFVTLLIRLNIIQRQKLVAQRKIIYVILLIVAVLFPTNDAVSLVLITLPLLFLFELGLILNRHKK